MIKRFNLPSGNEATLDIQPDSSLEDYLHILKWLHQRISERNWEVLEKKIKEAEDIYHGG